MVSVTKMLASALALYTAAAAPLDMSESPSKTLSSLEARDTSRALITRRGNSYAAVAVLFENIPTAYFSSLRGGGSVEDVVSNQIASDYLSHLTRTDSIMRNWWDNMLGGAWGDSLTATSQIGTNNAAYQILYTITIQLTSTDDQTMTQRIITPLAAWLQSIGIDVHQTTESTKREVEEAMAAARAVNLLQTRAPATCPQQGAYSQIYQYATGTPTIGAAGGSPWCTSTA